MSDSLSDFEAALTSVDTGFYLLRLYVSGGTERSTKAVANIRAVCEEHLAGRYELEVIDLYQQPHLAREANILAAPTLVRELPEPVRRVVGDMSNESRVLLGLNLTKIQ